MQVCWEVDAELLTFSTPLNIFKVTVYQTINSIMIDTMNCTHTFYIKHNCIIQQNSFKPTFHNSEILIIHNMQVVPKQQVLLCTRTPPHHKKKSFINEAGRSLWNDHNGLQECLYINCCGISWPLVSYFTICFSYYDFLKTKMRALMTWTRRYPIETHMSLVVQPKYRNSNTRLPVRT